MNASRNQILQAALERDLDRQRAAPQVTRTTDRGACGTCKYFMYSNAPWGLCRIALPPWVVENSLQRDVHDKYSCDLHRPKEGGA